MHVYQFRALASANLQPRPMSPSSNFTKTSAHSPLLCLGLTLYCNRAVGPFKLVPRVSPSSTWISKYIPVRLAPKTTAPVQGVGYVTRMACASVILVMVMSMHRLMDMALLVIEGTAGMFLSYLDIVLTNILKISIYKCEITFMLLWLFFELFFLN